MKTYDLSKLHIDLGFAFSLYVTSHLDSPLLDPLTDEPMVVFQTDDPEFSAYELEFAKQARENDDRPDRAVVLYYVPVPNPPAVADIPWERARMLSRFVIRPEQAKQPATT